MRKVIFTLISVALIAGPAWALERSVKCESGKIKILGKLVFCRQKADATAIKKNQNAVYEKCTATYTKKWELAESKAQGECPTINDKDQMEGIAINYTGIVRKMIKADPNDPAAVCGNDLVDPNTYEQCDGANLDGADCESLGYSGPVTLSCTSSCVYDTTLCECASGVCPATGQTGCWDSVGSIVACPGSGHDGDIRAGAVLSYTDNGDGTITDDNTGLMWEKESDDGSVHDWDTHYSWADAFAVHLVALNDPNAPFAGYTDWRIPNIKELVNVMHYQELNPSMHDIFMTGCTGGCTVLTCSCTQTHRYWSSTSMWDDLTTAAAAKTSNGTVTGEDKTIPYSVKAVRGP